MIIRHDPTQTLIEFKKDEESKVNRMINHIRRWVEIEVDKKAFGELGEDRLYCVARVVGTTQTERSIYFSDARDSVKSSE